MLSSVSASAAAAGRLARYRSIEHHHHHHWNASCKCEYNLRRARRGPLKWKASLWIAWLAAAAAAGGCCCCKYEVHRPDWPVFIVRARQGQGPREEQAALPPPTPSLTLHRQADACRPSCEANPAGIATHSLLQLRPKAAYCIREWNCLKLASAASARRAG